MRKKKRKEKTHKRKGESGLVCVSLMPGDTANFVDGQKKRRRDEWREREERERDK